MSVFNDLKKLLHSRSPFLFLMQSLRILPFSCFRIFSLSLFLIISFTLFPIISSSHFPIISEAWSANYYVDGTNGSDGNSGLSPSTPSKTIAKVNASRFNPGNQILIKRGEGGKVKSLFFN